MYFKSTIKVAYPILKRFKWLKYLEMKCIYIAKLYTFALINKVNRLKGLGLGLGLKVYFRLKS